MIQPGTLCYLVDLDPRVDGRIVTTIDKAIAPCNCGRPYWRWHASWMPLSALRGDYATCAKHLRPIHAPGVLAERQAEAV